MLDIIDVNNDFYDKTSLRVLKAQRSKLLNKNCTTHEEFEEIQNSLNRVELNIKLLENKLLKH